MFVTKTAAQNKLAGLIRQEVQDAAGNNNLLSHKEQKTLSPVTKQAAERVRMQNGKGTRPTVDKIIDKAMSNSMRAWSRANPLRQGSDSKFLSQAEIKDISQQDKALGALTLQAYNMVREDNGYLDKNDPEVQRVLRRYGFTDWLIGAPVQGPTLTDIDNMFGPFNFGIGTKP